MSNLSIRDLAVELDAADVVGGYVYPGYATTMVWDYSSNPIFNIVTQGTSINVGNGVSTSEGNVFVGSDMVVNNTPVFLGNITLVSGEL